MFAVNPYESWRTSFSDLGVVIWDFVGFYKLQGLTHHSRFKQCSWVNTAGL